MPGMVDALRHGVVMVGGRANDMNPGLDDLTGDPRSMETFPGVVMVNSVDESGNWLPPRMSWTVMWRCCPMA